MKRFLSVLFVLIAVKLFIADVHAQTWQLVVPTAHTQEINLASYTPDGKYIVTASKDQTIKFWRAKDGKLIKTINDPASYTKLQFDKDSSWALFGSLSTWVVINLRSFEILYRYNNSDMTGQIYLPQTKEMLYAIGLGINGVGKYNFYTYNIVSKERTLVASVTDTSQKYRILSSLQLESYSNGTMIELKNYGSSKGLIKRNGKAFEWKDQKVAAGLQPDNTAGPQVSAGNKLAIDASNNSISVKEAKTATVRFTLGSEIYAAAGISASDSLQQFWLNSTAGVCKYLDLTDGQVRLATAEVAKLPGYEEIFKNHQFTNNRFYEKLDSATIGVYENNDGRIGTRRISVPAGLKFMAVSNDGITAAFYSYEKNEVQLHDLPTKRITNSYPVDLSRLVSAVFSADNSLFFISAFMNYPGDSTSMEQLVCYNVTGGTNPLWKLNVLATDLQVKNDKLYFYHKYTFSKTSEYKSGYYVVNAATGAFQVEQPDTYYFSVDYRSKVYPDRPLTLVSGGSTLAVLDKSNHQTEIARDLLSINEKGNPEFSLLYNESFVVYVSAGGKYSIIDLTTRKKVADLFLFTGTNDWLLVTPDGRFDGTPAATQKLYYAKMAKQIKISAVYEKFYTPNLLSRIFARESFAAVDVNLDNFFETPQVKIIYAQKQRNLEVTDEVPGYTNTSGLAILTVQAFAPEDKVEEIRLFHNGKVVTIAARGLFVTDNDGTDSKSFTIPLLSGQNIFRAVALNSQRTESDPDEIVITFIKQGEQPQPKPAAGNTTTVAVDVINKDATLFLMVVGINKYGGKINPLSYALPDATAFREELEKDARTVLTNVKTFFISDAAANKANLQKAFAEIKAQAKPQDVFVFYFAGHGYIHPAKKEFYLVSADVTDGEGSLLQNGLASAELQQYAVDIAAQKQVFILDACQSAGAFEKMLQHDGDQQKSLAVVARRTGTHWIAASGSTETAKEFSELGHGVFTYSLLQALQGQAIANKMITVNGIKSFLLVQVPLLIKKYGGNSQYPAGYGYGNDFPLQVQR